MQHADGGDAVGDGDGDGDILAATVTVTLTEWHREKAARGSRVQ